MLQLLVVDAMVKVAVYYSDCESPDGLNTGESCKRKIQSNVVSGNRPL
ncbi:hypothetical protein BDI4_1080007 [Burkholderia diffusa]|nr:hypothetical protein BDI4_1080007 [Burkholderia diffusa]